jgi:hypothetical protein
VKTQACCGVQAGVRYWAENPDTGAHDFGARFNIIFLFPTGKKG